MGKRLTAEEVAETLLSLAISERIGADESKAFHFARKMVCETLVPHWQDEPDDASHAACEWWWCESVPEVPQLLRSYRPLRMNQEDSTFSVSMNEPLRWDRWTVSGWVPLVGRVCPIGERPKE